MSDATENRSLGLVVVTIGRRARERLSSSWTDLLAQSVLFAAVLVLYGEGRRWAEGSEGAARDNALEILRVEDALGLDFERGLQQRVLDHDWLVEIGNLVYQWLHGGSVGLFMLILWFTRRDRFATLRDTLILCMVTGVIIIWVFPVAPPRIMEGFVDTVYDTVHAPGTRPPGAANAYAAFPSFHVGWPFAAGLAVALTSRRPQVRVLALAPAVAISVAVITTGNHYFLDVVGGAAVAGIWLLVLWRRPTLSERRARRAGGAA